MSFFDNVIKFATRLLLDPVVDLLSGFAGAEVKVAHLGVIYACNSLNVIWIDNKPLVHREIVAHHDRWREMSHISAIERVCRCRRPGQRLYLLKRGTTGTVAGHGKGTTHAQR